MRPRAFGGLIAVGVVAADQAAKAAVLSRLTGNGTDSTALTPFLDLALRWNRGISFSLFAQNSAVGLALLLGLTLAATALLGWWLVRSRTNLAAAGLGAIIGGAIGNALDRIAHGAVVDYLDVHAFGRHFFVFNLADAAINIGVVLLVLDLAFGSRASDRREEPLSPPRAN
ncbi:MAG: signal peptidase II [Hyphomicrobiales bacterium]|nr:signal peptidase II [Hyphomicrobiales bacterium]MBV8442794.1 signal peptidase II [Hyphomicrobiales bacterium]